MTETILKTIWKWQITIPQEWRKIIGMDNSYVKARFEWWKVIIESLENNQVEWDINQISLDKLTKDTVKSIKNSEKNYKLWNKDVFISHNDFWNV